MTGAEKSHRKESVYNRDWTKGSVIRNLIMLSWPMVIMESLWVISQIVDLIWVGKLGPNSIAGVGIANIILMLVWSVDMALIAGVRAMIARHIGAGDIQSANNITIQAIALGILWGLLVTLIGIAMDASILGFFGVDEEVVTEGLAYLRVTFAGWVGMEIMIICIYSIQASGDTLTPMIVEVLIRIIHIVICPFLVLGWWVFPEMGVSGAALSNVISQSLGGVILLWILIKGRTRLRLTLKGFRFQPRVIWRILKIGIPVLVMGLQSAFSGMLLMRLVSPFGALAVAAHSLASRTEMFLFVPGMALGTGAGVLVGQNLGASQVDQAKRTAWIAVSFVETFMIICSIVILVLSRNIVGLFTVDPELIKLGSMFLRIATVSYLVIALSSVLQNCIAGAGDTVPNMIVSLAVVWCIQLPLAFYLSKSTTLGIFGIRWAMVTSTVTAAIAYALYFISDRWKNKKI
ncbi:MAG TPA: MATE family efflux transporter [Dehalococcoidia bacterium]|nr:MATE family efflux transporter [Dehalococcoidia bacterium]